MASAAAAPRKDRCAAASARAFYRLFRVFGETPLPEGAGDFRLIDRRGVEALKAMGERARFSKGLYAWIGFSSVGVPFTVAERAHGRSKWNLRKLVHFAFDGITSFSTVPLRVWTYIGLVISLFSIGTAAYFLVRTLLYGADVPGYPSLIVSVTFFSGIQLMSLGIIGEYVGRIFAEVKRRPLYLVAERIEPDIATERAPRAPSGRRRFRLMLKKHPLGRRLHALVTPHRLRPRRGNGGRDGHRTRRRRLRGGVPAAQPFPRHFRRGRLQLRLRAVLCAPARDAAKRRLPRFSPTA